MVAKLKGYPRTYILGATLIIPILQFNALLGFREWGGSNQSGLRDSVQYNLVPIYQLISNLIIYSYAKTTLMTMSTGYCSLRVHWKRWVIWLKTQISSITSLTILYSFKELASTDTCLLANLYHAVRIIQLLAIYYLVLNWIITSKWMYTNCHKKCVCAQNWQ